MKQKTATKEMEEYFDKILKEVRRAEKIANKAREKGYDPDTKIEIEIAENMAERVVGLISIVAPQLKNSGVVKRIDELEKKYGKIDWRVAFTIAKEIAQQKFCEFETEKEAIEVGIRAGFAYVTLGVVSAPLEGFISADVVKRRDGTGQFFKLKYSGPVRGAGGKMGAVSVLIADYVRKELGYAKYDPTEKEIKRTFVELQDYHGRVTNLQYFPSEKEAEFLTKNIPIQIDGDPTEKIEVSNYKGIERVSSDRIRGGFCLIMAECLSQKAAKLWKQLSKWGKDFGMDDWFFLKDFIEVQKQAKSGQKKELKDEGKEKKEKIQISPVKTYIKDSVAGRPVLGDPLKGFRLRYGRSRTNGFSAQSIHPATMQILEKMIAIGTQLKTERPRKGAAYTTCDSIEAPIVKLENGDVVKIKTETQAKELSKRIKKILFIGDTLVSVGDFLEEAHVLIPPGYCEEWWIQELEKSMVDNFGNLDYDKLSEMIDIEKEKLEKIFSDFFYTKPSSKLAIKFSKRLGVPLHPNSLYFWKQITKEELLFLIKNFQISTIKEKEGTKQIEKIIISNNEMLKQILEKICLPHKLQLNENIIIEGEDANNIFYTLGLDSKEPEEVFNIVNTSYDEILKILSEISGMKIRDKLGIKIGARMGRPEKAKMRKLKGDPHVLFPVGKEGGVYRSFQAALDKGKVTADFPIYKCKQCKEISIYPVCEQCHEEAKKGFFSFLKKEITSEQEDESKPYKTMTIDIKKYFKNALKKLKIRTYPDLIKGVRGTVNNSHIPERIEKGILRAMHQINVNKDGTTRYDASELPITHFKPKEIGTKIEKLKELGYEKDMFGNELENENQILEIKPHDILLPCADDSPDLPASEIFIRVAKFVDEELRKLYGLPSYYKVKKKEDLIGHLMIGLAPHTSAGTVCRIIGFTKTQGLFAHPYMHAAMRRDCDGDEAALTLLMDAFLNFSRKYLPETRGGTMDSPLVLTYKIIPTEVDDQVFNYDIPSKYSLEFYEACENYKKPWEVEIKLISDTIGTPNQYEGMKYTHPTDDINQGVRCSTYKTLPKMSDKLNAQMSLAEKIVDVNETKVAEGVIERHFIRDLKGNLRKFSQQQFRCTNCNEKYRRPPLTGKCTKCDKGNIIFTIHQGSIVKYLEPSLMLAKKYNVSPYIKQTLELVKRRIEGVFGKEKETQTGLAQFAEK